MELFPRHDPGSRSSQVPPDDAPLAERMRPRRLEDFEGQRHLLGERRPLFPVVDGSGRLGSMILWGPPGSGKTTLARLLAERAHLRFASLSAVAAGLRELREEIRLAQGERRRGVGSVLFIDEIHRFNKVQQDALLPHVEQGHVVLIGATTENPSFEVIPALRSRCRIFTLQPLSEEDLKRVLQRALTDTRQGLGERKLGIEPEAEQLLARLAQGDARRALTLLERAAEGQRERIDRDAIERALEQRPPDYDKQGEAHYDVISAFIKSLRGSDPDAALYWLARMLEGGEDPRFITRRMLIFASEDIGNADPQALGLAVAAADAFDRVGLPEGRLILAQAAAYLASTAKSNASMQAMNAASQAVREHGALAVPLHLRNAPTELMRREGYGQDYRYPHDHPGHFVRAQYLPDAIRRLRLYRPSLEGAEAELGRRLRERWGALKSDDD